MSLSMHLHHRIVTLRLGSNAAEASFLVPRAQPCGSQLRQHLWLKDGSTFPFVISFPPEVSQRPCLIRTIVNGGMWSDVYEKEEGTVGCWTYWTCTTSILSARYYCMSRHGTVSYSLYPTWTSNAKGQSNEYCRVKSHYPVGNGFMLHTRMK